MNMRRATPLVVAAIVVVGGICVNLRIHARRQQQLGDGDALYRLTYAVKFHAERAGARLQVSLPSDTQQGRVYRQDVLYSGLRSRAPGTFSLAEPGAEPDGHAPGRLHGDGEARHPPEPAGPLAIRGAGCQSQRGRAGRGGCGAYRRSKCRRRRWRKRCGNCGSRDCRPTRGSWPCGSPDTATKRSGAAMKRRR